MDKGEIVGLIKCLSQALKAKHWDEHEILDLIAEAIDHDWTKPTLALLREKRDEAENGLWPKKP